MALSDIAAVRLITQDNVVGFYFTTDDEIQFFLDRNDQNINRTSLEVAKVILLQLSMRSTNEQVDIFALSGGHKAAEQYRMALELFLKSPSMNPVLNGITPYAGGISKADFIANIENTDNLSICTPLMIDTSVETFEV